LQKAIKIEKEYAQAFNLNGRIYQEKERFEEAD
jgi:hypothetical protein